MPLREPSWWYDENRDGWPSRLLAPIGGLYGRVAGARLRRASRYRSELPVVCVGNFTAGGTGKTPFVRLLVQILKDQGHVPAVLTRGYGGRLAGPLWVDAMRHSAVEVGDEPLLLCRDAPVMVARNRVAGAKAVAGSQLKADVIVMDDGLQNPSLQKDLAFAVVDGRRGFGNGSVIPAGPLRAPLDVQARLVDGFIINRGFKVRDEKVGIFDPAHASTTLSHLPVYAANIVVAAADARAVQGQHMLAFAGIGSPQRFFDLLASIGAEVAEKQVFADHHRIRDTEAEALLRRAAEADLTLATTEKDWVRLPEDASPCGELRRLARVIPIQLEFAATDQQRLVAQIESHIAARAS